jgi:hypothetical protein
MGDTWTGGAFGAPVRVISVPPFSCRAESILPGTEGASRESLVTDLIAELDEAERKAIDNLARYKFAMFGYWAGIWVHLNRLSGAKRPNPFRSLVKEARRLNEMKGIKYEQAISTPATSLDCPDEWQTPMRSHLRD